MPLPTHAVAKATKNYLVTYRNHCSKLGDRTYKLRTNELENYDFQQPRLPATTDINLSVTDGAASPKYRAEGMNQACITDVPTTHHMLGMYQNIPTLSSSPRTATMELADYGTWRVTHPNKLPNPRLKYNWAYISDHKLYWWVGVTLKKKKAENSCWQELEKQSVSTIALGTEWLTPWAIPVTIQIMPRLT